MAQLLPDKEKQAPLAYMLLVIVLILAYYLLVNGYVVRHFELSESLDGLRQAESTAKEVLSRRSMLEKRLDNLESDGSNRDLFLKSNNASLGNSELIQRLKQVISDLGQEEAQKCQVLSNSNVRGKKNGGPFEKVGIKVRLRCDVSQLSQVLYELETGTPYLFTDNVTLFMQVSKRRQGRKTVEQRNLDARFDLAGYLSKN